MYPDWLPDELRLNRSLQEDIDELYALYKRDFIDGSICVVDDAPVYVNSIPDRSRWEGKYPHGFTHIVTRGAKGRTIDYDRAKSYHGYELSSRIILRLRLRLFGLKLLRVLRFIYGLQTSTSL